MTQMKGIRSDVGDRKSDVGGSEFRAQRFGVRRLGAAFHTQPRNTQGPGFASRDHYNVNGYFLTSSAVVGIDDAGIYSGGLKTVGVVDHRSRLQQKEVKAGANESKRR